MRSEPRTVWYLGAAPATLAAWQIRLRWVCAAVDAAIVVAGLLFSSEDFPLRRLAPLVAAAALVQADLAFQDRRAPRWLAGVAIGLDVAILSGLLELSGGPSNPFAVIYAVFVALAGATLGFGWAVLIALSAAASYGLLIAWHLQEVAPAHHRLIDFPTHIFTMWLSLVALVRLAGHFVREASAAIARREAELAAMREQAARTERLVSLTTLAAGAAHELSTPLGTIAVASHELERALRQATGAEAWAADARLIRDEVERCHVILDQMSGRAGGSAADLAVPTDVAEVFADLRTRLSPEQASRVEIHVAPSLARIVVPRAGLVQVLLSLVKNAFDASEPEHPVVLEGRQESQSVRLIVRDRGHGMSEGVLNHAGEPFFTTKDPGKGFGLGLFLARMFAERCGGSLRLQSGNGTTAVLELPLPSQSPGQG